MATPAHQRYGTSASELTMKNKSITRASKPKYILDLENSNPSNFLDFDIDPIVQFEVRSDALHYCKVFRNYEKNKKLKKLERSLIEVLIEIMKMKSSDHANNSMFASRTVLPPKRSAKTSDFKNKNLMSIIQLYAKKTQHPVIRTRLNHLAWDIDRSDWRSGHRAIEGYIQIIRGIKSKKYTLRKNISVVSAPTRDLLNTAIRLFWKLRSPRKFRNEIESLVKEIFNLACKSSNLNSIIMFGKIATKFDNQHVIKSTKRYVEIDNIDACQQKANFLEYLAKTCSNSGNTTDYNKLKTKEIDVYSIMADNCLSESDGSAIMAEHFIEKAIFICNKITNVKSRHQRLLRKLEDVRKLVSKEMIPINTSMNLTELIEESERYISSENLDQALFKFSDLNLAVDPVSLSTEAYKLVSEFPLSAAFGSVLKSEDGRTLAKTSEGATVTENGAHGNFEPTIAQYESFRRGEHAMGVIEVCRRSISRNYRVSTEKIHNIFQLCPNVPSHYRVTLSDGFEHYFRGDVLASVYILVPLVEEIIKQTLKISIVPLYSLSVREIREVDEADLSSMFATMSSNLKNIYGEAVFHDIERVFLSTWGSSIRHGASHALLGSKFSYSVDATYACWLIWKLCTCPFRMTIDSH